MTLPKPINDTSVYFEELEKNGKAFSLTGAEHYKAIERVNSTMEETQKLFHQMDSQSQVSASNCILNA